MYLFHSSLLMVVLFFCCGFTFTLQNSSVGDFVRWYAAETHKNVVLDSSVDKKLTVYAQSVSEADIDQFFMVVLRNSGLTVVNDGGFVSVRPSDSNTRSLPLPSLPLIGSPSVIKGDNTFDSVDLESVILSFKHRSASSLVPLFKSFLGSCSGGGQCPVIVNVVSGNRLFLRGDSELISLCTALGADLDLSVSRYLVEAVVVENMVDVDSSRGVEFSVGQSTDFGQVLAGTILNVASGGLSAVIDHADLSAVMSFFDSNGKYRILSTPSIILSDTETARLFVGSNIPVITGESTSAANPSDTPFRTVERRDVGLELKVSVDSLSSDAVRLVANISASSVSDTSVAGVVDVVTNQRQLNTSFDAELGQVVGIGGLISTDNSIQVNSIPWLSKIPFIGGFFRSNTDSTSKRNLSVFLSVRTI